VRSNFKWLFCGNKQVSLFSMLDSKISMTVSILSGFVPVWPRLLPKKQIIMGKSGSGEVADKIYDLEWRIQLGDWDAF
jgi:hypothetical protein